MITGKDAILQYFDNLQQPYFALFYKGKVESGQPIFRNDKDKDQDFDFTAGKQQFEKILQMLQYGDYTLIVSDTKNVGNRGANRVDFKITLADAGQQQPTQPATAGIGAVSIEEVERRANDIATKKFQELMDKKTLEDTRKENEELKKEVKQLNSSINDPWNKFIRAAAPHSDHIISGLFGTKASHANLNVSGVEADNIEEISQADNEMFAAFITALAKRKPAEWRSIIQKLTTLINDEPTKFEMAINLL